MEDFQQYGDSEIAKITPFTHERWPCTKQPSWNSSTNIFFQTIYSLLRKLEEGFWHTGYSEIAKIIPFTHQRDHVLNRMVEFFNHHLLPNHTFSWSENRWKASGNMEIQKYILHLHIKDGHALNSHFGILQPTSSKPYILLSRNFMEGLQQYGDSEIAKHHPFHTSKMAMH